MGQQSRSSFRRPGKRNNIRRRRSAVSTKTKQMSIILEWNECVSQEYQQKQLHFLRRQPQVRKANCLFFSLSAEAVETGRGGSGGILSLKRQTAVFRVMRLLPYGMYGNTGTLSIVLSRQRGRVEKLASFYSLFRVGGGGGGIACWRCDTLRDGTAHARTDGHTKGGGFSLFCSGGRVSFYGLSNIGVDRRLAAQTQRGKRKKEKKKERRRRRRRRRASGGNYVWSCNWARREGGSSYITPGVPNNLRPRRRRPVVFCWLALKQDNVNDSAALALLLQFHHQPTLSIKRIDRKRHFSAPNQQLDDWLTFSCHCSLSLSLSCLPLYDAN